MTRPKLVTRAAPIFQRHVFPSQEVYFMHECAHERTTVRWKNQNIGMIGRQCDDCGKAVGSWLKHSEVPNIKSLGQWIEREEIVIPDERMPLRDTDGKAVKYIDREAYHQYLQSPVWKRRFQ